MRLLDCFLFFFPSEGAPPPRRSGCGLFCWIGDVVGWWRGVGARVRVLFVVVVVVVVGGPGGVGVVALL